MNGHTSAWQSHNLAAGHAKQAYLPLPHLHYCTSVHDSCNLNFVGQHGLTHRYPCHSLEQAGSVRSCQIRERYLTERESVPIASAASHCLQVEYEIMTAYVQNKTSQLDAVLEVLFQDTAAWPQAPPPTYLREACLEVVYTLVGHV